MAKAKIPTRWISVFFAIFGPVFLLLWALSGNPIGALRGTGILVLAALGGLPIVIAAILIPVALHELGHLLGGKKAGFLFHSLRVGPWTWTKGGFRTNWKAGLPMGLCAMAPPRGLPTRGETLVFIAGGPLASLAATLLGVALTLLPGVVPKILGPLASLGNGTTLFGSLLPFRTGGFESDGLQLLDLWKRRTR